VILGPYGTGGTGGDKINLSGRQGSPGGVVIVWGNGINS
jgi:hypothetical protein